MFQAAQRNLGEAARGQNALTRAAIENPNTRTAMAMAKKHYHDFEADVIAGELVEMAPPKVSGVRVLE